MVRGGLNYAQAAKVYLASNTPVIVAGSETPPMGSSSTAVSLANQGKRVSSCPKGCIPISRSATISIVPTSSIMSPVSSPAAGCPVQGESCTDGALACSGYDYGQCANGVWIMRQCASGLACFETSGVVYCDWASKGVIQDCSGIPGKAKRDEADEFIFAHRRSRRSADGVSSSDVESISTVPADNPKATLTAPVMNTTTSNAPISDIPLPVNVTFAIQGLNSTHFVAVLQATTMNNTPILNDWSITFQSDYRIVYADRGNLTYVGGLYSVTSIPIQEPDQNMAIMVKLLGEYTVGRV
jgi:hypothetical protein